MKIVKFYGGLGNQMFQYAFLISLRESMKCEVKMDTSLYSSYGLHNGFELPQVFNITAQEANKEEIKKMSIYTDNYKLARFIHYFLPQIKKEFKEKEFGKYYSEVSRFEGDRLYDGYWQHWEYFDAFRDELLKEYTLREELDIKNKELLSKLQITNSCSVHIRRGDYLKSKNYRGLCGKEYYREAIRLVKEKAGTDVDFYFFSNDYNWCTENLSDLVDDEHLHKVDWNKAADSYKDMILMSGCKFNIIANSSFSWWGAYLNLRSDKEIIAPKIWINKTITNPIQMPSWILL